ncbi:ki-ras-induced actin-interacting protein-IP3R-interacting domain olf186-M isoform X5 [Cotesia typhae]|uniref:ki-ras-induced actin-interacting protein-IP3R-interacting domain olf186-M isoform X5 n=1 Tax=Cotesia typhae TaxID=2053667 RepID=UPI003D688A5C
MIDPENVGKEAIIRVTDWLRGIWEMRRNGGPVQQWVNSIPSPTKSSIDIHIESHDSSSSLVSEEHHHLKKVSSLKNPIMTLSAPSSPAIAMSSIPSFPRSRLVRDPSLQSDSSHCSSVESLLELRKPDPEAILLGLGFGGGSNNSQAEGPLSRIPKRFLQPSKLRGIAIDEFVRQQQETNESIDTASLGYRGLTGQKSFAFNGDGDLIEIINSKNHQDSTSDNSTDSKNDLKNSYIPSSITAHSDYTLQKYDNEQTEKLKRKITKQKSVEELFDFSLSESDFSLIEPKFSEDDFNSSKNLNTVENNSRQSRKYVRIIRSKKEPEETPSNIRRASDGAHIVDEKHSSHSSEEGRRFSDGIIKSALKPASDRRRSFRRQARINDVEAASYENDFNHCERLEPEVKPELSCNLERRDLCCESDESEQICRHDAESKDCCCHASNTSCWRKMRKMMKKNQKLENMVVKSRQEMAEIRGMLSTVLSVRMEPGF